MATPSEQIATMKWNREQRNARIQALAEKARAFDEEHTAIVALQQTAEYVQPHVLRKMLAYSARMESFEAELAALNAEEIKALVATLGFPSP
jgi:hypothetical protein